MQVNRDYLLELDRKRLDIEKEIMEITDYLNSDGMPGVNGRLIDNEGFPIPNVDLMAVRTARNRLIMLQNDLKSLMVSIEQNMQIYFKKERENKVIPINIDKKEIDKSEPIAITVSEEKQSNSPKIKIPFAWITSVENESPAEEAGLIAGDGITSFDYLNYGMSNNPLQIIAEIVRKKINSEITVEIVRNDQDINEYKTINLIPHQWCGHGLLG